MEDSVRRLRVTALAGVVILGVTSSAQASLIATIPGTDCSGVFGIGLANCVIPDEFDPDNSPVIIKFNADGTVSDINSVLFPTISGSEFSFEFGPGGTTGTWTYTPGADDPATLVAFFVAKGGNFFNLFSNNPVDNTDAWMTPLNPANGRR